jgi:hypothetical protein
MHDTIAKPSPTSATRLDLCRAGFLARYSSPGTVDAFSLDLRLLFELYARYLEQFRGKAPTTIHRRLSTIRCSTGSRPSTTTSTATRDLPAPAPAVQGRDQDVGP